MWNQAQWKHNSVHDQLIQEMLDSFCVLCVLNASLMCLAVGTRCKWLTMLLSYAYFGSSYLKKGSILSCLIWCRHLFHWALVKLRNLSACTWLLRNKWVQIWSCACEVKCGGKKQQNIRWRTLGCRNYATY